MENLKRPAALLNLLLIIVLAFLLYRDCEGNEESINANGITQADIDAMKDSHFVTLNDAVKMYKKYDKLRLKFTKDSLKRKYGSTFNDTRMVWFDIKSVRAYLQYLENNVSEAEGLAFYFGVNSSTAREGKNHQSFFVAPTIKHVVDDKTIQSGFTFDKKGNKVFLYKDLDEKSNNNNSTTQEANFFNLLDHHEDGTLFNGGKPNPPGNNN